MACCGGIGGNNNNRDGLFETNESFCLPGRFSSARIAPLTALPSSDDQETKIHPTCDNISNSSIMDNARNAQQQQSSAACGPDSDLHLIASASSHESCSSSQQHQHPTHRLKKRPLAVAVGYKYAEDMNGRPIVITPQRRSLSPALYNTAHRTALIPSSSSPVAHRDTQTVDNWNNFFSSGTTIAYLFSSTGEPSTEERQLSQRQEQC